MVQYTVETRITAKNEAGTELEKFTGQIGDADRAAKDSEQGFKVMGLSLTDLYSGFQMATGVAKGLVDAVKSTIDPFIQYAEQVRDLGRNTGMSAEESSKLIQVADDLKVEYGSLTTAAKMLAKEGLVPNIDTLAEISDKYLSLESATERAKFAQQVFGRNYQEMTKILEAGGEALKAAAESQPEGLILSQEDLDAAREYERQMDALNDTFQAIVITIGKGLVPALSQAAQGFLDFVAGGPEGQERLKRINEYLSQMAEDAKSAGWGWEQFNKYQRDYVQKYGKDVEHQVTLVTDAQYAYTVAIASTVDQQTIALTKQAEEAASLAALAEANLSQEERVRRTNEAYAIQQENLDALARVQDATTYSTLQYNAAQESTETVLEGVSDSQAEAIRNLEAEKRAADEARQAIGEDLAGAYQTLAQAQQDWKETVADDALAALKDSGASAEETAAGIEALDQMFGTNIAAREQYLKDQQAIADEYAKTGDIELYKEKMQELADTYEESLAKNVILAREEIVKLEEELNKLPTSIDIPVNVTVTYSGGPVPTGAGTSSGEGTGATSTDTTTGETPPVDIEDPDGSTFAGPSGGISGGKGSMVIVQHIYNSQTQALADAEVRRIARKRAGSYMGV